MNLIKSILLVVCLYGLAYGQTALDLRTQSKSVDFSAASSTKPFKTGTIFPATCSTGDVYFKADAPAGQNLYGCTSTNTWTLLGGSAGPVPSSFADLSGVASVAQGGTGGTTAASARTSLGAAAAVHAHSLTDLTGITGKNGAGGTLQAFGGGTVGLDDCAKFDASGNLVSAGSACGNAATIHGNLIQSGTPSVAGQFYGWDQPNSRLALFSFGNLLSVSGSTINVASDSVPQYAASATIPSSCSQYGLLYFDSDAPTGSKFYYCNGSTYEQVGSGGDFSSNTSASVDGEIVLFSGSGGKTGKRATGSGIAKLTSGVLSTALVGTDYYAPGTTIASTDLPNPSSSAGGKVQAKTCAPGEFVNSIATDSTVGCGTPPSGGGSSAIYLFGNGNGVGVAANFVTQFFGPGTQAPLSSVTQREWIAPRAGTLRNLRFKFLTAQNSNNTLVCTVRVNNVPTAITFTLSNADGITTKRNTTDAAAVAEEDTITIACLNNANVPSALPGAYSLELQ
jgi:hypothetical protein